MGRKREVVEFWRRFLREDLVQGASIVVAFIAANQAVVHLVDRPDKVAISFLAGILAALAGAVAGRLLQSAIDRRRGVDDD